MGLRGGHRVRLPLAVVALTVLFPVIASSAAEKGSGAASSPQYRGWITCGAVDGGRDRVCGALNLSYAVFKSKVPGVVRYTVCINRPVDATQCRTKKTKKGLSSTLINSSGVGTYKATFKVNRRVVAKGKIKLKLEPGHAR